MANAANVYVGVTKGRRGNVVWETVRTTPGQVWDAIFYQVEQANAQYPREKAPEMLGNKWQVVGISAEFPPALQIDPDGITVRS